MAQNDGNPEDYKWFASDWRRDWYREIDTPHGGVFGKSQLKLVLHMCKVHIFLCFERFLIGLNFTPKKKISKLFSTEIYNNGERFF